MMPRTLRRLFSADAIGLLLVLIALQTLSYGIASSLRNTDTGSFFYVTIFAALIGLGLSKSRWNGFQASAGIAALGVIGIWILGAGLVSPLVDLGQALLAVTSQILPSIRSHTAIDTSRIVEAWDVLVQASSALVLRVERWTMGLNQNVIVNDALMRNLAWILILWLFSAWVGWFAGRRNAILSIMPCVFLLAAVVSYSGTKVETLWLAVFVLLLLMGVWNYRTHTQQWEKRKVDYSESIRYDVSQAVLFLSIVISTVAFITPSVSWRELRDYLRERNQTSSEAADLLGIQEERIPAKPASAQKPALPREHLLSGGYANSQKIVMTVRTGELPPIANPTFTANAPRYYWRSVTYDQYTSAGWVTSSAAPQSIPANTPLIPGLLNGYKLLHLDVQMVQPEGKMFWSGILFSANIPFTANWRIRPTSNLFADQPALLQSDLFAALTNADSYKVESYIPNVSISELRAASTAYPEEIAERYLPLPMSVPERVHELARAIVNGKANPYDRAQAIEGYLRANYPYDLEVPAPPEDMDVADYFLFELRKGYCDYYATSMVVLARSSGLPARFVSGYAPGSYDAPTAQYFIRELNAHSWAEIYFPEIGWVEFEPTASQPEIERVEAKSLLPADQNKDSTASDLLKRYRFEKVSLWGSPLIALALLTVLYYTWIERWLLMRLVPVAAIERMVRRFYRAGRPLAGEWTPAETAHEFARKLIDRVEEIREGSRFTRLLARLQDDALGLTSLYQRTLFVDDRVQKRDVQSAWHTWKRLRWRLWFARILFYRANRTPKVDRTWRMEK